MAIRLHPHAKARAFERGATEAEVIATVEEGSQARRSSKGITSCIVEGYGRKRYKADLIKFLVYAHASCDEKILPFNFIKNSNPKYAEACQELINPHENLRSKINRFIQFVEGEWKGPRGTKP